MALPYQNSSTDPSKAQGRIQATLRKFRVGRIIFDDDIDNHTIKIMFSYNNLPVVLPVDYKELGDKFLEQEPYTSRRRGSKADYEFAMYEKAFKASYAMLEDLVKAMISIVNVGVYSFEDVFLGFFMGKDGRRVAEILVPQLQNFSSKYLLTSGK